MRNPFKRKALTGSQGVLDAIGDRQWSPWSMLGGGSRERIMDAFNTAQSGNYAWIYSNSPAVRTVVDVIVRNIGQLDLRLYEEISEAERQPRPDHPAALSIRYPNETTPGDQFLRSLIKDFLIHDNAYALMLPAAAGQITFQWLPAHMVQIRGASLAVADGYRVWRRDGTFVDIDPDQMLHWHGENPNDPRQGISRLDTLRGVIAEDAALQQATVELAQSGLQEPIWVKRPLEAPMWSNQARKGFEEDLTNRLKRRNRMPVVLEEGMDLMSFGVSPRDAQMFEVRRWAIERVASLYGVPLGMVGMDPNVKEAQEEFYSDCLPPYCGEFSRMLTQRVLVRAYDWLQGCFEFNLHEKQIGIDTISTLVSASGGPIMLRDEARAMLNRPPLADGQGREIITPLNVIEGAKPSPAVMPPQDPNGPAQDGSYRLPPGAPAKALTPEFEPVPQLLPRRKADLERQHRHIDEMQGVVQRHFNRLERSMRAKGATDWARWDREFSADLAKALKRIVDSEGALYAMKLGGHDFDIRRVENYLKAMAEGAAGAINDTVRGEVDQHGLDGAMSLVPQHVASAGTSLGARSTIWAREEAARQTGTADGRVKVWVADSGRHGEFDGQTVGLGEDWPAGFAPGSAPGCACTEAIQ